MTDVFGLKDLKVLKCRGCRLQNINPQVYNLLNQLTDLDLGNNQVIYSHKKSKLFIHVKKGIFLSKSVFVYVCVKNR